MHKNRDNACLFTATTFLTCIHAPVVFPVKGELVRQPEEKKHDHILVVLFNLLDWGSFVTEIFIR